jgi:pilus assembly protein Flp/PilA
MTKIFARFLKDESGATAIEYGLIAALISVALIAGATTLGNTLSTQFTNISSYLDVGAKSGGGSGTE